MTSPLFAGVLWVMTRSRSWPSGTVGMSPATRSATVKLRCLAFDSGAGSSSLEPPPVDSGDEPHGFSSRGAPWIVYVRTVQDWWTGELRRTRLPISTRLVFVVVSTPRIG